MKEKINFQIEKWKIIWFWSIKNLKDWFYKITEIKKVRSLDQNRLYWGYIIKFIVLQYKDAWIIYTKDYIHKRFKKAFLPKERIKSDFSKKYILKSWSTTNLTIKQFTDFINNIKIICEFWELGKIKWLDYIEGFVIPDINEDELLEWIDKIV